MGRKPPPYAEYNWLHSETRSKLSHQLYRFAWRLVGGARDRWALLARGKPTEERHGRGGAEHTRGKPMRSGERGGGEGSGVRQPVSGGLQLGGNSEPDTSISTLPTQSAGGGGLCRSK